ncbi:MAG: 30S ribosome-binding factor RbfA [Planctomycetota bacterium]|nr:MAG: 30S ribosome-binding factor RbfA [Planctomycetota bacterium]
MTTRRMARVARAIQEVVSTSVLFELKDPRIANVTVLRAEVSSDLRHAKVYVSVMGDEKAQSLCMRGLNSARGYLQAKVARRLQTRYTPLLRFVLDDSVKKSIATSQLIRRVMNEGRNDSESDAAAAPPGGIELLDTATSDGEVTEGGALPQQQSAGPLTSDANISQPSASEPAAE